MNDQLTFSGDAVATCNRCGIPTNYKYERYDGEQCRTCRAEDEDAVVCDACETEFLEGDVYPESYYFTPFDSEESDTGSHYCQSCLDHGDNDPDGQVFYCDGCSRNIASDNGRMSYYRILNECEQVCLRCITEDLKAGGVAGLNDDDLLADVLAGRKLFAVFFNVGELEAEGWQAVDGWHETCINATDLTGVAAAIRTIHEAGDLFIVEIERMSIIGDEGYITIRRKAGQ